MDKRSRTLVLLVVAGAAIWLPSPAHAAPPPNDDFPGTTIASLPFSDTVDTTFATFEDNEFSVIGPTAWYNYTPTTDVELWADTFGSDFRAIIDLRDFTGNPPSGVDQEFYDCESLDQGLFYGAKAGETLYFQVGSMPIGPTGTLQFNLEEYSPDSPEVVCYGQLGPPYEGYGGDAEPTPVPAELPAGDGSPPSGGPWPWEALLVGGPLAALVVIALAVTLRRAQK